MTDGPGTGGGSGKRFAAVMGAIVVVGLLALGAAWWFLDRMVEEARERRRKLEALDRKIEAYLPTDRRPRGATATGFVIRLRRERGSSTTRVVTEANEFAEFTPTATEALQAAAAAWRTAGATGSDPERLRGTVEADPAVPTTDVVRAVDALIAGGLKDVTFVGTPEPGSVLDRIGTGGK